MSVLVALPFAGRHDSSGLLHCVEPQSAYTVQNLSFFHSAELSVGGSLCWSRLAMIVVYYAYHQRLRCLLLLMPVMPASSYAAESCSRTTHTYTALDYTD